METLLVLDCFAPGTILSTRPHLLGNLLDGSHTSDVSGGVSRLEWFTLLLPATRQR